MFRFWTSESRGCDKPNDHITSRHYTLSARANNGDYFSAKDRFHNATASPLATASTAVAHSPQPLKRRRSSESTDGILLMPPSPSTDMDPPSDDSTSTYPPSKRIKMDPQPAWPSAAFGNNYDSGNGSADDEEPMLSSPPSPPASVSINVANTAMLEQVKDTIQHQFGLEILLKHNELRLIDQELAKCQIALEQLRRCHLVPYPVECPTPAQMLDVAAGRGVAVRPRPGADVPQWAAPFGVVDGPYARHYARWLIPDPVFDSPLPNWPEFLEPAGPAHLTRSRQAATAESRAARANANRGAAAEGTSTGRAKKDKNKEDPVLMERSDGQFVWLVCQDCHRFDFSSTQGFINHCRISHSRDFKSHAQAAWACGHLENPKLATNRRKPGQVQATSSSPAATAAAAPVVPPVAESQTPAEPEPEASASEEPAPEEPAPEEPAPVESAPEECSPEELALEEPAFVEPAPALLALKEPAPKEPGETRKSGEVQLLTSRDSQATDALLRDIDASIQSYSGAAVAVATGSKKRRRADATQGRASTSTKKRLSKQTTPGSSNLTPHLARLLENTEFSGILEACVKDATISEGVDDENMWVDDDTFEKSAGPTPTATPGSLDAKRFPSGSRQPLSALDPGVGTNTRGSSLARPKNMTLAKTGQEEEMDVDMSPKLAASNKAPSLISDDDEYDDSDDGSVSEASHADLGSAVEVSEMDTDEDEEHVNKTPRSLRQTRSGVKSKMAKPVAVAGAVQGADN